MTNAQLLLTTKLIAAEGPDRVVVSRDGYATTPKAARDQGVIPVTIFIRDDLWSLGTPRQFEQVAYKLWENAWVARMMWTSHGWKVFRMDGVEVDVRAPAMK